ncbi:apolipoprotein N-acyltransferase [Anaerobiospirillum succiniciproducens]|uniref:apolipoprotein N-acyltransferase n=1 Tax=Anaerobiospirillum succiniciproducens TaxID=13335 RepID=UPI00041182FF|nr:apolipoprotein N-acyltransferase [Anaerobiospirillum succiniciproducens]
MLTKLTLKLYKYTDTDAWARLCHTKTGIFLVSVVLGALGTLGFAPYNNWVVTLATLAFEFFFVSTFKSSKRVFFSLLLYFTAMNTFTLEWLNYVMTGFGGLPPIASYSIETLFSAYLAIFHACLGTLAFRLSMRRIKKDELETDHSQGKDSAATAANDSSASAANDNSANASSSNDASAKSDAKTADADDFDDEEAVEAPPPAFSSRPVPAESSASPSKMQDMPKHGISAGSTRLYPILTLKDGIDRRFFKNAFLLGFLPAALVLADYIIGVLFTGFPWMYVGYTTVDSPFASFAPLVGVRGISLLFFICAGAIALAIERRYVYLPVAGFIFFVSIIIMGIKYVTPMEPIKVAGIQGNIEQSIKWDPNHTIPSIKKYMNLTSPELGKNDVVIWPESAMPVYVQQIVPLLDDLNFLANEQETALLMGIQRVTPDKLSYNSMYVFGQSKNLFDAQIYDKRHLVPFGEVVPFENLTRQLGSIFNFPMSSFSPGALDQEQIHIEKFDLKFIPALCYESIFPELMLSMYSDETNGIIMISNDSWYGDTRGPIEHLAIARMRSMEMQKPMIRVTNSGITAYIDELGAIVERLPSDEEGVLHMQYVPTSGTTPYAKGGIYIFIVMVLATIALGFMLRRVRQDAVQQQFNDMIRP